MKGNTGGFSKVGDFLLIGEAVCLGGSHVGILSGCGGRAPCCNEENLNGGTGGCCSWKPFDSTSLSHPYGR